MISASQIALARPGKGCPRRWYFRYVAKIRPPEGNQEALDTGTRLHSIAEDYLSHGKQPDPTDELQLRFMAGLRFLPPPGSGTPEQEIHARISGVDYICILDWLGEAKQIPAPAVGDPGGSEVRAAQHAGIPAVLDHKTTKNPKKKYDGKKTGLSTKEDFLDDPQACLEATIALIRNPTAPAVLLVWVYYATEGHPYAEARYAIVTRKEVVSSFARGVHRWGTTLVQLGRSKRDPLTVAPWVSHCEQFKSRSSDPTKRAAAPGCPYQDRCIDVTAEDKDFAALKDSEQMAHDEDELLALLREDEDSEDTDGADRINGKRRERTWRDNEDEAPAPKRAPQGKRKAEPEPEKDAPAPPKRATTRSVDTAAPAPAMLTARDLLASSCVEAAGTRVGPAATAIAVAREAYVLADALLVARAAEA